MAELLVSVRSAWEAEVALDGGAGLIDVKEPAAGSLGRAADEVIAAVIRQVAGRRPVSAALGELAETPLAFPTGGLRYVKCGLAGWRGRPWSKPLAALADWLRTTTSSCRLVAVSYADSQRADAPPPQEVCTFAAQQRCGALLLDTWGKDSTTLLDWLSLAELHDLSLTCQAARIPLALAGRLGPEKIDCLQAIEPAWFAVRGAVCRGGRTGTIDRQAVRRLADRIAAPVTAATLGS